MTEALRIAVLGGLAVVRDGAAQALPPSRKTRALLGYLVLTARAHRRERLCELFWDVPDDPRGALRWSLSKLRPLVDAPGATRLIADRERVAIDTASLPVDWFEAIAAAASATASDTSGAAILEALRLPLLDGLDLPDNDQFQAWLTAQREEAVRVRRRLLAAMVARTALPEERLVWCREWLEADPFNPAAADALQQALLVVGRRADAAAVARDFAATMRAAGLEVPPAIAAAASVGGQSPPGPATHRPAAGPAAAMALLQRQKIRFCTADDGVRIAYASVGEGPPLVKAANWLNHLELDWDAPIWAPLFRELARDHCFIRYDERGNGLSEGAAGDISFEAFVRDLETVVDAAGVERFPLLGLSQGCAVAIEYAARHPERVSHLILWGGYAAGWRVEADTELRAEREAIITLVRQGWDRPEAAYRQLFSSTFLPGASTDEIDWFNGFQRQTARAANAARFLEVFADIDVRHRLGAVRAPALVMHARGDQRIPIAHGGALAAGLPNAEFVALDSPNHLLLGREPASAVFVAHVREFLAR